MLTAVNTTETREHPNMSGGALRRFSFFFLVAVACPLVSSYSVAAIAALFNLPLDRLYTCAVSCLGDGNKQLPALLMRPPTSARVQSLRVTAYVSSVYKYSYIPHALRLPCNHQASAGDAALPFPDPSSFNKLRNELSPISEGSAPFCYIVYTVLHTDTMISIHVSFLV